MSNRFQIGNISSGHRSIRDGREYDKFFPKPAERDRIIIRNGDVEDTVELMKKVVWKYIEDTKQIAQQLKQHSVQETCRLIWNFMYNNIQYKLDKPGLEQLRRPARSWQERQTGIDCDCFSIFISSILTNLHIPHKFRIARYDKDVFQHVYVIVPLEHGQFVIDPVLSKANYEKPYKQKKDFTMSLNGINVAVLDGTAQEDDIIRDTIAGRFDGLGSTNENDATLEYLVRTRNQIAKNPAAIATVEDPIAFIQMLDYAIKYWNTPQRKQALDILIQNEDSLNIKNGYNPDAISGLDDPEYEDGLENDWSELDGFSNDEIEEYLDTIEEGHDVFDAEMERLFGLGYLGKGGRAKRKAKRDERKKEKEKKKETKKEQKEQKKQIKATTKGKARREAMKSFRKENKRGFFQAIKKGAKAVVRYNPLSIAARNGFLLAMKLNLFKIAERLKWGYATPEQAKGKVSDEKYQKAKKALADVEKLFADKLQGKREKLQSAILKGKSGGLSGIPDNHFSGLGEAISAGVLVTAASSVIISVVKVLSKNGLKNPDDPSEEDIENQLKNYSPSGSDQSLVEEYTNDADNNEDESDESDDGDGDEDEGGGLWTFIKNNPMVAVGGAVGIVGLGYLLLKPKNTGSAKSNKELSGTRTSDNPDKVDTIQLG